MKINTDRISALKKESQRIRNILIDTVSKNGGHLAPNLGVVELTQALIEVFDLPNDKVLFDVGHQSYVYKLLTGREEKFESLRQEGGLSPFSDPKESEYDFFIAGHAGSALSAGAGIALANPNNKVIIVVGDASIANGHSLEALNHIGENIKNVIVILNDNEMSIGKNVGALSNFFGKLMISDAYVTLKNDVRNLIDRGKIGRNIKNTIERIEHSVKHFFLPASTLEKLGFNYIGVLDGHNIEVLIKKLNEVKKLEGPIFIHIKTHKGKGYKLAEENKEKFHGISPFDPVTGKIQNSYQTYSNIFGSKIVEIAEKDENIYAISAAMIKGVGLEKFQEKFNERCIDVGIAEGHAVSLASGLSISGKNVYVSIYSTFYQRTLGQLIHDVGLQNLPIKFIVDRAGVVGEDGKTHQGLHDINIFLTMPNFSVIAPTTGTELEEVLEFSKNYKIGPLSIRFPRDKTFELNNFKTPNFKLGKWNEIKKREKNLYLATGVMLKEILDIDDELIEKGIEGTIVSCSSIRPLDEEFILNNFSDYENIFTFEDGYIRGGFGDEVLKFLNRNQINKNINIIAFEDAIIPHGKRNQILETYKMKGSNLIKRIEGIINVKK